MRKKLTRVGYLRLLKRADEAMERGEEIQKNMWLRYRRAKDVLGKTQMPEACDNIRED